ncbi:alpha/beta fold hydrolase [Cupriavidus sp. 2TAF22]|uniref:alpha/beta fold hydrolase n=1 Tax=unclassified Cupriavidus TaxID=2640874 RepID=UPI003F8DFDD1
MQGTVPDHFDHLAQPDTAAALAAVAALERQAGRTVTDAGGCRVVWRRFGQGRPLILLHGGHGSWLHWVRNIEALAARRTVWAPDMPGFGESGDIASELPLIAGTLAAAAAQLPGCADGFDLAGFSFGGLVAANVAANVTASAGAVGRLALLGSAGHAGVRRQQQALVDWRKAPDERALAQAMCHNLAAFMIADPARIDAMALHAHTESCRHTRFRSKPISRAGGLREALDRFGGDVLLAWGEHDVTAEPMAAAQAMAQGDARRQVRIVPGAGHWVQYEAHEQVNALLDGWLA